MQGKGIIKFFLVALAIVSVIQFMYMIPTNRVEKEAETYAQTVCGESNNLCIKAEKAAYLDSMSSEVIFRIPLLKSFTYQELKGSQLNFGLDLKGGMSVLLQVDLRDFIRTMAGNRDLPDLEEALKVATAKQKESQSNFINLFVEAWQEVAPGKPLNTLFKRNDALRDRVNSNTSDSEMAAILREEADKAVDNTFKLLRERIDKLGVVGPTVSLDKSRDLILVELPGVENPERARRYLQAAAKLEFWNVYRITDPGIQQAFRQANEKLRKMREAPKTGDTTDTGSEGESQLAITDSPGTDSSLADTDTSGIADTPDFLGEQGPLFDIFTPNDGSYGLAPMGVAEKNKRKAISEMLEQPGIKELFPRDVMFLWSRTPFKDADGKLTDQYELYAIKKQPGTNKAPLEGDLVTDAYASPDPSTGKLAISLKMNGEGAMIWGQMTTKAAQDNNREIAIVLDSAVVSAPRVINPITTGDSQITGNFDVQEAQDIANILEIGKLPTGTQVLHESLVGPSLGAKNIQTSLTALLAGFILVLVFMLFYYGSAGLVSIVVLFLNVVFMLGAIASLGTVLTLPGIAGIILTIGMAVDANVIIYERVREELRVGKSLAMAIRDGYVHSYSAIIDGNVTTFLTAVVLFVFGLGPVKGFAVVLMIGILSTLFTAVAVSRLLFEWWLDKGKTVSFWTPPTKNVLANLTIDWMAKRKVFYVLSGLIIAMGIASFFVRGFDLGVDFRGGYSMNIEFPQGVAVSADEIRKELADDFGKEPTVKAVDTENTFNIVTDYLIDSNDDNAPEKVMETMFAGLSQYAGNGTVEDFKNPDAVGKAHVTSFSKVGPTVANDLRESAWEAVIFGLLAIFLYILIRFSKWQYSLGAVIATTHDALVVVSLFSLLHGFLPFPMEVDQAFIAAILTIIGYSVNDTVIVYDRIREYFGLYPDKGKNEVINMAINSTMSRTVITGITTLFTVFVLWLFGSGSIKGFAFALVIGVVVGTYSSIFIASPIMSDLSKADIKITQKKKGKKDRRSFTRAKSTEKA
ncbi:MAG TPA: protein translocase subunit SecDF [Bacteroidetes bacterium]|nr:protein translocase subunit SecDF [Bacteroidota bacterium]